MTELCGCCEGVEKLTPANIANRPGLDFLKYRVGTHASFLQSMIAHLTELNLIENPDDDKLNPLLNLKTRALNDPALAFLDACATLADVLSFYQERIANEGYLTTARERRSILELARLVGYELRPGVSATTYLAFTMEDGFTEEIPAGTRAQSIPGPGELPQSFETAEPLLAKSVWNELKPRMSRPQLIDEENVDDLDQLYFKGTSTGLRSNDVILVVLGDHHKGYRVVSVHEDNDLNRTKVELKPGSNNGKKTVVKRTDIFRNVFRRRPFGAIAPLTSRFLFRNARAGFSVRSDLNTRLLTNIRREARATLTQSIRTNLASEPGEVKVFAFRIKASLFGHSVPLQVTCDKESDPPLTNHPSEWHEWKVAADESNNKLFLDNEYPQIVSGPERFILIHKQNVPDFSVVPHYDVSSQTRTAYGMSAKSTVLTLFQDDSSAPPAYNWWNAGSDGFSVIRGTVVYAQSEQLELAEEPIDDAIGADPDKPEEEEHARRIELGDYFEDLDSGRWIVVSGERLDIPGASGVKASELVMLAGVLQDVHKIEKNGQLVDLPGDTPHTTLLLANRLSFQYKRDTVTINGNVVKATNGETREQILGSGDSSQALQRFDLNQKPLTHVSAATPNGIESTLQVRVNEVLWDQTDSLAEKPPDARVYVTHSDNENNTSVSFGNGEQGARLPTGVENVKAVYRVGTGEEGNVKANQISQLATKPVGVKEVINPLPATGGANREQPGQARINAPIPLKALERTVSVQDYADFARAFTGIGKASALRLSDGRREFVHLTIAGANDIAIDVQSDLYRNLRQALFRFGDPHQPLQIDLRELKLIIISARIQVLREFLWEKVEPRVRQHLLQTFGFASRDLGQDVTKSEVISAIQAVEGVDYVDLDILDAVGEEIIEEAEEEDNAQANEDSEENLILDKLADRLELKPRIFIHPARVDFSTTDPTRIIRPAQIAVLSPEIPDTFTLSELTR